MDLNIGRHTILVGDVRDRLRDLPDNSVHCVVTSPPYFGLRDYGVSGQIGLEPTLAEFIATMVDVFRDVRRVLRPDGTCWLNIGDSYAANRSYQVVDNKHRDVGNNGGMRVPEGLKPKDLMMVPARLAIALQEDGWWLRSDVIWHKKAPMPESVTDRPTSAHEHIFLLAKQPRYFYDGDAIREPHEEPERGANGQRVKLKDERPEPGVRNRTLNEIDRNGNQRAYHPMGRNSRNVWTLGPEPFPEAHFATFPTELPRRAIKAGTSERGVCAACGAPWVRLVERESKQAAPAWSGSNRGNGVVSGGGHVGRTGQWSAVIETTGWAPSCACDADVIPATVLDPFLGSGTTMLVADQLGRTCVGVELNPEYAEMAKKRVYDASPLQLLGAY